MTHRSVVNIAMLLIAVPLIERLGRRTLLIWCAPISICSLLIMGGVLQTSGPAIGPVLITFSYVGQVSEKISSCFIDITNLRLADVSGQ